MEASAEVRRMRRHRGAKRIQVPVNIVVCCALLGSFVDILFPLPYILPACSRYVPCALYVLSLYTVMWSERSERPAARAAVRAARSGPLVIVIRYYTIPL